MSNQIANLKSDPEMPTEKPSGVRAKVPEAEKPEYITAEQREIVTAAIRRLGVVEASKRLGVSSEAMLRCAGAFGSHPGTDALIAQRIERLEK